MTGFPSLNETERRRLSQDQIDAEVSLRGFVGSLTGKDGAELESLIITGVEFGRQHEAADAPTLVEIRVAGGLTGSTNSRVGNTNSRAARELRPSEA